MDMYTIKPIETKFDGYRMRSRTEARYAVMFRACSLAYEYEMQGYSLELGAFLPDFFLLRQRVWLEVKGPPPTLVDECLCQCFATETRQVIVIAEGQPGWETVLICFTPDGEKSLTTLAKFFQRWVSLELFASGIEAARSARFEHGETPNVPLRWQRPSKTGLLKIR